MVRMLVLRNTKDVRAILPIPKFAPSWEGLYLIKADVGKGCYDLATPDGEDSFGLMLSTSSLGEIRLKVVMSRFNF